MKDAFIVIDFETTGLHISQGARATEVAGIKVVNDEIVDSFQSLIKTGAYISSEIENLTGISNKMMETAPPAGFAMTRLAAFLEDMPLVAHNARFDARFLDNEFFLARINRKNHFACTMKIAKHVYPNSPNYKLATLLDYADIPRPEKLHRAMSDAKVTLNLWFQMKRDTMVKKRILKMTFDEMRRLEKGPIR